MRDIIELLVDVCKEIATEKDPDRLDYRLFYLIKGCQELDLPDLPDLKEKDDSGNIQKIDWNAELKQLKKGKS